MQYVIITEAKKHTHADAHMPHRGGSVMTWRLNGEETAQDFTIQPYTHKKNDMYRRKIQGENVFFWNKNAVTVVNEGSDG